MGRMDKLIATGERELVYACSMDRVLGIGFSVGDAGQVGREQWGQNAWGQGLDAVRSKERMFRRPGFFKQFDKGGSLEVGW
jgi:predicted NAD-dependent protein-ADP-ribosyltransferase YbiA (DUF1768 family)